MQENINNYNDSTNMSDRKNGKKFDLYKDCLFSQNRFFSIDIYDPTKENYPSYRFIYGKDGQYYLPVEKNSKFEIKMNDVRAEPEYFGSTLYIDGKEIQKIKTGKFYSRYFGFKKGNGNYESFVFSEPDIAKDKLINTLDRSSQFNLQTDSEMTIGADENFGLIKIDFFETFKKPCDVINDKFKDFKNYNPNQREANKKFCLRNSTVRKGDSFKIRNTFRPELDVEGEMKYLITWINFEKKIDTFTIRYQDFCSLNILGIVNLSFYISFILISIYLYLKIL